jgi:hypothetical protein
VIELAPAVIGHVDAVHPVIARQRRVFRGGDALEDERDVVEVLEPLHVIPAEGGLELLARGARAPRLDEASRQVALAPAVHGGVHGQAERGVAVVLRALHVLVHPRVVAANVELEDAEVIGRGGDRLEARIADRAQHLRHVELGGRLRGGGAAARLEGLHRADGRDHDGNPHGAPEQGRRAVELRDVAKDARPEGDRVERLLVAAQGGLGLGAAREVVPRSGRELEPRGAHDLVEGLELAFEVRG